MIKRLIAIFIFCLSLQVQAFEDYIITTKGKLTDIKIENNSIINVYPLVTIMNNKNTLILSPLKIGKTKFSVLRNNKEKFNFNVEVLENKTTISQVKGFEILSIDEPEDTRFKLDEPPKLMEVQ